MWNLFVHFNNKTVPHNYIICQTWDFKHWNFGISCTPIINTRAMKFILGYYPEYPGQNQLYLKKLVSQNDPTYSTSAHGA